VLRRAVLAPAALVVGLVAGQAQALGLGEIELDSALNERLVARIELLDAGSLQPTEILVSLASQADFERIGVERFFYLTDLRFEVVDAPRGKVVRVTSSQPITEPYLNFIVQAHWPSGRLLREYTLLLDPPSYGETTSAAISAPVRDEAPANAGRVDRSASGPATQSSGTEVALRPGPARTRPAPADGEYRMTTRNDTMWRIASEVRPAADVTIQQTMVALLAKNPEAFIRGNVNLLKAGPRVAASV
jgi:pilus assembly protein FimV